MLRDILKPFATKNDVDRRFNALSKKIKEILDLLNKSGETEEEAMFSKKHLGPQSCASCAKGLVNMLG